MYALGHLGLVLLAFAPIARHLRRTNRTPLAAAGTIQVAALSTIPDADLLLASVSHRGVTHTVWFALAVGSGLATLAALRALRRPPAPGRRRWTAGLASGLIGAFAVLAHLVGDVITPMGITPLAPVVDAHYSLAVVNAADPSANNALFALGVLATTSTWIAGRVRVPRARPTPRTVLAWLARIDRRPWRTPTTHRDDRTAGQSTRGALDENAPR
ncbi:metal-dependent hydrolase [Halorubellus litoreus]|uniref:Metal-dependent hydrolase n=1 Tax=Halorubellus litoreus TaxID=755308 RepID=A0ABD5V962_9EURY